MESLKVKCTEETLLKYIRERNLGAVRYHLNAGIEVNAEIALELAVRANSLKIAKLLLTTNPPKKKSRMLSYIVCEHGNIALLKLILENGFKLDKEVVYGAATHKQVAMLKYLFRIGVKVKSQDIEESKKDMKAILQEQFNKQESKKCKTTSGE